MQVAAREQARPDDTPAPSGRARTGRRLRVAAVVALAAGIAVLAVLWLRPADKKPPAPPPPVPVVAAPAQPHDVAIVLDGLGTVQALNAAVIRSQVTGVLTSVGFTEGQTVHRGDVLAQIDPRPYQAALDQAQAQLGRDQAQLADVQTNLGRNVPLLNRGFATDQQVTDQRYQIAQLQSTLKYDQGVIDNAATQLSFTTLAAPFDGVAGLRLLDVGNVIHPTDPNGLVVVTQVQPISVVFTLPSRDIAQVQDALARGAVKAVAYDQSGKQPLDTGRVLATGNQADPQSGTVQIKAVFPNAQRRLWPGTFSNVELTVSVAHDALTVPTDAVQTGSDGGAFVWVVGPGDKVATRQVEVTQRVRGTALVGRGLNPGDMVVSQGQYRLGAGTVVRAAPPSDVSQSSTATAGMLP